MPVGRPITTGDIYGSFKVLITSTDSSCKYVISQCINCGHCCTSSKKTLSSAKFKNSIYCSNCTPKKKFGPNKMIGQTVNDWKLLEFVGYSDKSIRKTRPIYNVQCIKCGHQDTRDVYSLSDPNKSLCRNCSLIVLGFKINLLEVIELVFDSDNKEDRIWKCRCKCGNEIELSEIKIKSGLYFSCGCSVNRKGKTNRQSKIIPYWYIESIKEGAELRGLEFKINHDELDSLFSNQNNKCAITGEKIDFVFIGAGKENLTTASLDRIDNNTGYILSNVHWVHKDVNRLKRKKSMDDLFNLAMRVVKHQKTKESLSE